MNCEQGVFSGLADIVCKLGKVNGFMLTVKGTTFTDATFVSATTHHVGIASKTTASRTSMVFPVLNWENTTDDVTIQTSNLGYKDVDGKPIPSALAHIDVSAVDYQTLAGLEGKLFDIILFTDENKQIGCKNTAGLNKGFRAKIAFKYGLPPSDNGQLQFAVYIFFRSQSEFQNVSYAKPSYSFTDLVDFVPVGLTMTLTTAYVAGTFTSVVKVVKRGTGLGFTGLLAADFEILESTGLPAPVTVTSIVDNGGGSYDVLIKNATPAALASGEYYKMQASDEDAVPTYITYLSNVLMETVA